MSNNGLAHGVSLAAMKKLKNSGVLLAVFALSLLLTIIAPGFITYNNWMNILRQASINCIIAAGMLMVLLTAGIDLSVGSNLAMSTCIMAVAYKSGITNSFVLIVLLIIVSTLGGLINGLLYTRLRLPHPFISTLGTMMIYRGLALLVIGGSTISSFPNAVKFVGNEKILGFPISFIVVLIMFAVISLFLNRTPLGRKIYSVGGNPEAALLAGVKVKDVYTFVYTASGFMSGFAGLILLGRVNTAYPLAGENYSMDAIAACVIGGASFNGGKGSIWGMLIGALFIAIMNNGLTLLGASSDLQKVVIGIVVIIAVAVDVMRTEADEKAKRVEKIKSLDLDQRQA